MHLKFIPHKRIKNFKAWIHISNLQTVPKNIKFQCFLNFFFEFIKAHEESKKSNVHSNGFLKGNFPGQQRKSKNSAGTAYKYPEQSRQKPNN